MDFAGSPVSDLEKRAAKLAKKGLAPKSFLKGRGRLPKPPPRLAYLLVWYWDLRRANLRGWRFEPIPHSEIESFGRLYRLDMTPFDVSQLRALDGIWQSVQPEPEKPKDRR